MKRITFLTLCALLFFAGNAVAANLTGTWLADNWCVPGEIPSDPNVPYDPTIPKYESSTIEIDHQGMFFTTNNIVPSPGEECGGVVDGKSIFLTCPGTLFQGELKGQNEIIGINHNVIDGATCSVTAYRQ